MNRNRVTFDSLTADIARARAIPTDAERREVAARELAILRAPERRLALAIAHIDSALIGIDAAMDAAMPHLPNDHASRTHAAAARAALLETRNALAARLSALGVATR